MDFNATQDALPMQRAVATAWPSAWIDGLVAGTDAAGLTLLTLDGAVVVLDTGAHLISGEPVAFHPVAEVIGIGGALVRARRR